MKKILETNELFAKSTYHIENDEKMQYSDNQENNDEGEINEKLTVILDQQEKEAFNNKLRLTKAEYNMFLLGMLHAMIYPNKTLCGKEKQNLTIKYTFNENKICEKAFQIIHSLSIKKWESIRQQYRINSIKPMKHALLGRKSHNALSFTTILNVLTFIVNYANYHGLPSP
ncbi:12871_t:CDS:2, partial [Cetraspora pellucida]